MLKVLSSFLLFLTVCLLVDTTVHAQSNASDAAMEGYVRDTSGAAIKAAKLIARNVDTNISAEATTDDQGYFRFAILKVGRYELTATADGFSTYVQTGLSLVVGQAARVDVSMQVGAKAESVQVNSDAPITDTGTAATGAVLSAKEVEELPVISRNIYNFHLLSPGVQGLTSSTFGTTQFTFGGTERSYWTVDGLDNTQKGGNRQIRLVITTPEAVEEMQVLANGYSAEFGRAAGGQVNVILKSGTNDFHGSALFLYRFSDMQARPSLAAVNPNRTWHDEAFTLGGPIIKNKLFFFGQYESNPYTLPTAVTISPANAAALKLPASQLGNSPFGETYRTLVAKVNYSLNEKNSGYVRYSRFTNHQPDNAGGLTIPNRGASYDDRMNGGAVQLATLLTPNLVNEVRGGVIQRFTDNPPVAPLPGAISAAVNITGVANIGYNPLAFASTNEQSNQILDNLTWTHGRSTWKFGVDYEHTAFNNTSALTRQFTFGGLPAANEFAAVTPLNQYLNTLAGVVNPATGNPYTYTQFTATAGNPNINVGFNFINFFAQDEFRVTPNLTFNVGLRYEAVLFPTFNAQAPYPLSRKVNSDLGDWAPRAAFTWSPFGDRKTVIRGAYGMYYDIPPLSVFYNAAQQNGKTFLSYSIPGTSAAAPAFPTVPDLTQSGFQTPSNINAFAPGFHNAYQHQANLQIQRELGNDLLVTVGTNFAALRHGLYSENSNLGAPVSYLADGRPVFGSTRPNPQFNQINLIESGGNSNYNSVFINLTKRISRGLSFAGTYTYSHALSNTLGEGGSPEDPTNLARDYGNSEDDVRHYLVVQGLYEPLAHSHWLRWINGFEISTSALYNSGYPINVVAGTDLNNDGILNDRPLFRGRNDTTGPSIFQLDARLARSFTIAERYKLTAILESENLLNSTNASCSTSGGCSGAVVNTAGAADFGRIIGARTARNVQLGAKFTF
ncbi:MAG TPA: TonB-dependent receptor [Bryobacteraceae bacterium]|nr:TonB-dependent receptor [Bryobacteraceae bacterium]